MEEINKIHRIISDVLGRRSLDHRTCYTSVYARPPEGLLVFECSEREVSEEVRRRINDALGDGAVAIE
jgi:hypothetical protein